MLLLDAQNRVAGAARAARNVAGRAAGRAGAAAGRAGAEARRAIERAMAAQALIPRGLRAPDLRGLLAGIVRRAQRILGAAPVANRRPAVNRAPVNAQVVAGDEILARRIAEEGANNNVNRVPQVAAPVGNGTGPLKNIDLDNLTRRVVERMPDDYSDGLYMAKHLWLNAGDSEDIRNRSVNYMKLIKYQNSLRRAVKNYVQQFLPRVGPTYAFDLGLGKLVANAIQKGDVITACHAEAMNQVLFPMGAPPGNRINARLNIIDYYLNGINARGAVFKDRFQESSKKQIETFINTLGGQFGGVCLEASLTAIDNTLDLLGGDVDPVWPIAQTNLRTNGNKLNRNSKGALTRAMSAYLQRWEELGYTNRTTVNTVMRNIANKKLKINGTVKKVKDVQGVVKPVVEEVFEPIKELFV